jgi:hypothetical protein
VDKDFITQCDWIAWHRLTWANDTRVVDRILGGNYATDIETLDNGEAFLQADWEQSIERVQFRKKRTFDAGATPGFGETADTPDLKPVDQAWLDRFDARAADADPIPATPDSTPDEATQTGESESNSATDGPVTETDDDQRTASDRQTETPTGSVDHRAGHEAPPEDPRSALLEFGQLVAHVGHVAGLRVASALSLLAREAARVADSGVSWVGRGLRSFGARTLDAVERDDQRAAVSSVPSVERESGWDTPDAHPVADRLVGLTAVLFVSAVVYLAVAVV